MSLSPGSSDSGTQSQVIEDASLPTTFVSFVLRDESGDLATKVRAVGEIGTVCGTASVWTVRFASGETVMISLTPSPDASTASWLGEVPAESGEFGLLTWIGGGRTLVGRV